MYLEISARRTHKTSRLVRELDYHLASHPENRVCLTVHQMGHGKHIKEMINPRHVKRLLINTTFTRHIEQLRGIMLLEDPRVLCMWDEFDFIKDPNNVPIMARGYYNSTPKFTRTLKDWANWRNDPLLRLLVANDFMYVAHHGMKAFFDKEDGAFEDTLLGLGADRFAIEFLSGFDKVADKPKRPTRTRGDFSPGAIDTMIAFRG